MILALYYTVSLSKPVSITKEDASAWDCRQTLIKADMQQYKYALQELFMALMSAT